MAPRFVPPISRSTWNPILAIVPICSARGWQAVRHAIPSAPAGCRQLGPCRPPDQLGYATCEPGRRSGLGCTARGTRRRFEIRTLRRPPRAIIQAVECLGEPIAGASDSAIICSRNDPVGRHRYPCSRSCRRRDPRSSANALAAAVGYCRASDGGSGPRDRRIAMHDVARRHRSNHSADRGVAHPRTVSHPHRDPSLDRGCHRRRGRSWARDRRGPDLRSGAACAGPPRSNSRAYLQSPSCRGQPPLPALGVRAPRVERLPARPLARCLMDARRLVAFTAAESPRPTASRDSARP